MSKQESTKEERGQVEVCSNQNKFMSHVIQNQTPKFPKHLKVVDPNFHYV